MTKAIYTTLGVSLAASLLLLGTQQQKISSLKSKAKQLKATSTPILDLSQSNEVTPKESAPNQTTDTSVRSQLITRAEIQLQEIIANSNNTNQDILAAVKVIPLILEVVSDLHTGELLELFNKLSATTNHSINNKFPSMILGALLAESAPLLVLNTNDANNSTLNKIKSNALNSLMHRDTDAGMEWYRSNKNSIEQLAPLRRNRINNIMSLNLIRSNPSECIKFLSDLPTSELRKSTEWLESFKMTALERNQLISALSTRNSPQLKESIAQSLYRSALFSKDKQIFTEALNGISQTSEQRQATLIEAVDHVLAHSGSDLQKVVDFINTVSSVQDRPQVMKGAMESWAYRDTKAAGEWLQELEASPTKDATMAGYAQTVVKADPEAAMEWLDQISDPTTRKQATQDVMKDWEKHDADAAQKWKEARVTP